MAYLKGYMVPPEVADTFTGTCTTAAGTAAKAITVQDTFTLKAGAVICVKFTNTNTASNPTFKVNNGEAKSIWYNTAVITTGSLGMAGTANKYSTYIFDGTNWVWLSQGNDSNTTYTLPKFGIGYGINEESASTLTRSVTINDFVRTVGGIVTVKFTNGVTHESNQVSKLNVQNTGAAEIYYRGSQIPNGITHAGDTVTFVYGSNSKYNVIAIDSGPEIIENVVAPREQTTAVGNRAVGDEFILGDDLYKAIAAISQGDSIVTSGTGQNATLAGTIVSQLKALFDGETLLKIANSDLGDANIINSEPGIKIYYLHTNSANAPTTDGYYLIDYYRNENYGMQIAVMLSGNSIYMRARANSATWSTTSPYGWKQIYDGAEIVYYRRWDGDSGYFTLNAQTASGTIFTVPKGVYVINTFCWDQTRDSFWMYVQVNGSRSNNAAIAFLKGTSGGSWIIKCPNASNTITLYNRDSSATGNLNLIVTMTRTAYDYT